MRTGMTDRVEPAMSPVQSGARLGDCCWKIPRATVSSWAPFLPTSSGHRKSFHIPMIVMRAIVMIGPVDMGMVTRKKRAMGPRPSSIAASSISRGSERKNCRRKNTEKGAMNRAGSIMPCIVSSHPSCLTRT